METILRYFPHLTPIQRDQFSRLGSLYGEWNSQINVISRKDIDALYERHVLHSLAIARIITFRPGTSVLDVGTGGGFPGIPLAILFPDVRFHLVDSIGKKIMVCTEIAAALGLSNVTTTTARVETLPSKYDFVVSRAVTILPEFYKWVHKKISRDQRNSLPNGILYLKGGDLAEEIAALQQPVVIYPLQEIFTEPFFETKKLVYIQV